MSHLHNVFLVANLAPFHPPSLAASSQYHIHSPLLSHPLLWIDFDSFKQLTDFNSSSQTGLDSGQYPHIHTSFNILRNELNVSDVNCVQFLCLLKKSADIHDLLSRIRFHLGLDQDTTLVIYHPLNIFCCRFTEQSTITYSNIPLSIAYLLRRYPQLSPFVKAILSELYLLCRLDLLGSVKLARLSVRDVLFSYCYFFFARIPHRFLVPRKLSMFLEAINFGIIHQSSLKPSAQALIAPLPLFMPGRVSHLFSFFRRGYAYLSMLIRPLYAFCLYLPIRIVQVFTNGSLPSKFNLPLIPRALAFILRYNNDNLSHIVPRRLSEQASTSNLTVVIAHDSRHDLIALTLSEIASTLSSTALRIDCVLCSSSFSDYVLTWHLFRSYPFVRCTLARNNPLGFKWQHAVNFAMELNPDNIMILGSDDIPSSTFLVNSIRQSRLSPSSREVALMPLTWYLYETAKSTFFKASINQALQPVPLGAGRLYPRRFLHLCGSQLFDVTANSNLDNKGFYVALRLSSLYGNDISLSRLVSPQGILLSIKQPRVVVMNTFEAIENAPSIDVKRVDSDLNSIFSGHFRSSKILRFLKLQ